MTYRIGTNTPLEDISLRYCSCCLKKFCPRPEKVRSKTARFFVPTIDVFHRSHFAYVEVPKKLIEALYDRQDKFSIDLGKVANVLHIEIGDCPSPEREEEIVSFYDLCSQATGGIADAGEYIGRLAA